MSTLLLKKTGVLEFTRSYRTKDSDSLEARTADVSNNAIEFLGEPLELADDVRFIDLLRLLEKNPALHPVFTRVRVEAVLATLTKYSEDMAVDKDIDHLEFYQVWEKDAEMGTLENGTRPSFHGVGREQVGQDGVAFRPNFGFGGGAIYDYMNLPVRVNRVVELVESHADGSSKTIDSFEVESPSLFQVLYSMLWELTYFGSPTQ